MNGTWKKKVISVAAVSTLALGTLIGANLPSSEVDAKAQHSQGKVKNVIFMIPDGYSTSYATNYRWFKGEETVLDSMLVGMHQTYSADSKITDSAAAGTAMATGEKTNNGMVSTTPEGEPLQTILQAAEDAGKSSGLVATSTITHATPAVFVSHVPSRADEAAIAPQLLENDVDVILGGGKRHFSESLLEKAERSGYELVLNRDELLGVTQSDKVIGLFADGSLAPELDRDTTEEPSLAEMTEAAINVLNRDNDGFFLMVEGSQIDWAGHANDAAWAMKDTEAFEEAVKAALDFAKKDKKTLLVVAGDHDTGGMSVGGFDQSDANVEILREVTATGDFMASQINEERSNIEEVVERYTSLELTNEEIEQIKGSEKLGMAINKVISERALIGWSSTQHTGVDIPIYAYGPSADSFRGLLENTELPKRMASAMKIKWDKEK